MGANIRIFSMRSARFWGNFKVWGQNIHPCKSMKSYDLLIHLPHPPPLKIIIINIFLGLKGLRIDNLITKQYG